MLYHEELEMHGPVFQLCPPTSRDPKHVFHSAQVVITLPVLVAEGLQESGGREQREKGGKKKSSEMDDGQPDRRMLSRGLPFSWNLPGAACLVRLSGSPSPPAVVTSTLAGCLVLM